MDKFQIVELTGQWNHAGTKATADIAAIAQRMGFQKAVVSMATAKQGNLGKIKRQIGYFQDWKDCYHTITNHAVVLLQHPFHYPQLTRDFILQSLKDKKQVKFISMIHDVEELRAFRFNDYYRHEFETMRRLADVFIVHNQAMKKYLIQKGLPEEKLVVLEIFDYLQVRKEKKPPCFDKVLNVAGNLDITKCGYIGQLGQLSNIKVRLYGPNFHKEMEHYKNISYEGSYPVGDIPAQLTSGFGLVWDGESIHGCTGQSGQYLRYNNPHKLSLYLSCGLPVVIWKDAAEAEFVEKNGVGILAGSLMELEKELAACDQARYLSYVKAADQISQKMTEGWYAERALRAALELV